MSSFFDPRMENEMRDEIDQEPMRGYGRGDEKHEGAEGAPRGHQKK